MKYTSKTVKCNIHNFIELSPFALKIIDTEEFQRLKNIKQLGLCHNVFPSALHTRFEHSIGTYHLAGLLVNSIKKYKFIIPKLKNEKEKLSKGEVECIKIAGLCHDLGHGPYSHIFDDIILKNSKSPNKTHEVRSCLLTKKILNNLIGHNLMDDEILTENHIEFIIEMINPSKEIIEIAMLSKSQGLYQIVSNTLNGIDVDKFDYLIRDCNAIGLGLNFNYHRLIYDAKINDDGNISYPYSRADDVYRLFYSRYDMHKNVYNHPTVKCLELMLQDIIILIDSEIHLSESIDDMDEFCKFTDSTIFEYILHNSNKFDKSSDLMQLFSKFRKRVLYKCVDIYQSQDILDKKYDYYSLLYPNKFRKISYKIKFDYNEKFNKVFFYTKGIGKQDILNKNTDQIYINKYMLVCIDETLRDTLH